MGKSIFLIIALTSIFLFTFIPAHGTSTPTIVILVHGYSITGSEGSDQWQSGVNLYQQLINAGYIVGVVAYYGGFYINYSNGYQFSDTSFQGTSNTPIENIAQELYIGLQNLYNNYGNVNIDIVAHSMGGLIVSEMMENEQLPLTVQNVIFIGTPFLGSPFASIASYLGLDIIVGYQADEMVPGSTFLTNLQNNMNNISYYYPSTELIVYAGNYDPWWGYLFFSGDNDGVVSVNSATAINYNYAYEFPDLHTSEFDSFTYSGISYFEDQNVANTIISNLNFNY
ncbi:MAG: esterase/lipase family protein [Thermoplasmata archaeon]